MTRVKCLVEIDGFDFKIGEIYQIEKVLFSSAVILDLEGNYLGELCFGQYEVLK